MSGTLDKQRTYAIIGTAGCGKTSLAEMLLFNAGAINRLGKIEEGSTTLDYDVEEISHKSSLQPAFATYEWNGGRHFLIDLPGDNNFIGDLSYLLTGVDGVVFVIDAVDGVRPLGRKLWKAVYDAGLPAIIYVNKIDRDRANFDMAVGTLSSVLGIRPVLMHAPLGEPGNLAGMAEIFANKALLLDGSGQITEGPIPAQYAETVAALRDVAIENIAESDEELLDRYLEEGTLSDEQIVKAIKTGAKSGELVPVFAGAALSDLGGKLLLGAIENLLPSPLEHADWLGEDGEVRPSSPDAPPAIFIFNTIFDPFSAQLYMGRVLSGTITSDMSLKDTSTGESERLANAMFMLGKNHVPCKEAIGPGAIVALSKMKSVKTGHTLSDEKRPFSLIPPQLPPQLISYALAPKEKGGEDKVYAAIQKILEEDLCLRLYRDEATSEILVSGMGQLHIEIAVEKAQRRSKVDIVLKTPKVPYRETIQGKAQVQGRHKKQTGGRGQFGDCWIEVEPLPRGSGYEFEDAIVGGAIPKQYIPAVDKGIQESALRGFLAGCPVVDFKAKLYDGSYHNVDSSEMAFKIAGSLAFKKAMEQVTVKLLEPVVLLTVSIPDEFMGDVIGDLSSRRGKVLGSDSQGGITEVRANVPMREILRYAPDLRAMTSGQGMFTVEFDHYEEAPAAIVEKVVAEYQAAE